MTSKDLEPISPIIDLVIPKDNDVESVNDSKRELLEQ